MSTIASPRDPSAPFPRRANSSQALVTPTSSSRPSLDVPASASGSPNPNPSISSTSNNKRANRAALREYYNLRSNSSNTSTPPPPTVEITDHPDNNNNNHHSTSTSSSSPLTAELDAPGFDAASWAARLAAEAPLADLLRTYARVLAESRALDAERKALVYDNYSKLIAATETIRRMRAATMDADGSMAQPVVGGAALALVVERVYELARGVREGLRKEIEARAGAGEAGRGGEGDETRRRRTRELAREVIKVPGRVRRLVEEGREEEARREWEMPRKLLERWREKGLGGEDVEALIEAGDTALRGGRADEQDGGESAQASTTT